MSFLPGRYADERMRITSHDAHFRAVVYLFAQDGEGNQMVGTGFAISPTIVMTSAHCLLSEDIKKVAKRISVSTHSHGEVDWSQRFEVAKVRVNQDFQRNGEAEEDFALLLLHKPLPLRQIECFQLELFGKKCRRLETVGFPDDKAFDYKVSLWGNLAKATWEGGIVRYQTFAYHGQSGSPMFRIDGNRAKVSSILQGATLYESRGVDRLRYVIGTPITPKIIYQIEQWLQDWDEPEYF